VDGGAHASQEEAMAVGLNESLVHVDFMIGSPKTDVDGVHADGSRDQAMRLGRLVI